MSNILFKLALVALLTFGIAVAQTDHFGEEFVVADVLEVEGNVLTLGRNCTAIVAEATADQARSIALGKEKRIDTRPLTHDIFVETLREFNITIEETALTRYADGIYYATIVFRSGDRLLKLDARPSDAMALVVRTDAPMKISTKVLKEQGRDIC